VQTKRRAVPAASHFSTQRQKPLGIAHHIAEQPIDRPERARVEGKRTLAPMLDGRQAPRDPWVERRLVNADPPARRALAEPNSTRPGLEPRSTHQFARPRSLSDKREQLPEL